MEERGNPNPKVTFPAVVSNCIVISSSLGDKKKIVILKKAKDLGFNILNVNNPDDYIKNVEDKIRLRKEKKKGKEKGKEHFWPVEHQVRTCLNATFPAAAQRSVMRSRFSG